jgi:hypothetical protein
MGGLSVTATVGPVAFSYMSWERKQLKPDFRSPKAAQGRIIAHRVKSVTAHVNREELDSNNRTTLIMYGSYVALILMASVEFFANKTNCPNNYANNYAG